MPSDLGVILSAPFTFSPNCAAGLSEYLPDKKCLCCRCMRERGETPTAETEEQARVQSIAARAKQEEWMRGWLRARPI